MQLTPFSSISNSQLPAGVIAQSESGPTVFHKHNRAAQEENNRTK